MPQLSAGPLGRSLARSWENMIKYLSLMVLVFFVESCYTIILKPKSSPAMLKPFKCQTVAAFNVLEFKLNYDLIDTWESN